MYKSPIDVIQTLTNNLDNFYDKVNAELEKEVVYRVRMETKINIDKDELFKALRYDRAQYEEGYADGHKDGYAKGFHDAVEHLKKSVEEIYNDVLLKGEQNNGK